MAIVSRIGVILVLLLAGCGGGSDDDASQGGEDAEPALGKTTVAMKDLQFSPTELTVKVGDTVTWVNQDAVEHNVVADSEPKLKSELFGEGERFEFKPTEAGSIAYVCTVHPGMEGTLTVQ